MKLPRRLPAWACLLGVLLRASAAVVPADHAVLDAEAWRAALATTVARASASSTSLVTLGVVPTRAETGFGYIVANGERVVRFTEKPDAVEAARLIADGARWNAGTFACIIAFVITISKSFRSIRQGCRLNACYQDVCSYTKPTAKSKTGTHSAPNCRSKLPAT